MTKHYLKEDMNELLNCLSYFYKAYVLNSWDLKQFCAYYNMDEEFAQKLIEISKVVYNNDKDFYERE